MRPQTACHTAAAALVAAFVFSACSGPPQSSTIGPPSAAGTQTSRTGDPQVERSVRPATATARIVYVAQPSQNDVVTLRYNKNHNSFTEVGTVSGAASSVALWVDRARNVYVANAANLGAGQPGTITENNEWGDQIFSYSTGILVPRAMTVDRYGNVYEAEDGPLHRGDNSVREFPQGVDSPVATCTPPNAANGVGGIAVDKKGDVFVDYVDSLNQGDLFEYPGGLIASGCNGTQLPVGPFASSGSIAFDPQNNVVVCDPGNQSVYIIPPPYDGSNLAYLEAHNAFWKNVTITKKGTQAYVTDGSQHTWFVSYPSGTTIATIGQPAYAPAAAVDIYNYTP